VAHKIHVIQRAAERALQRQTEQLEPMVPAVVLNQQEDGLFEAGKVRETRQSGVHSAIEWSGEPREGDVIHVWCNFQLRIAMQTKQKKTNEKTRE
jgi:hypothetical protein